MSFNVLICDDSSLARKMARRSLPRGLAKEVFQASNGQEALAVISQHPVELLILDLTMPILDGVGVLEEIRAQMLEVFVVVVSGDIQPQMREKVLKLGALDFIPKPVDTRQLSDTLHRFGLY
ncbi:response regulator [Alteromonas pelagimontana]|uniref:Response regulator n=1 Tax=Alteromonas pelagimontana TaxID=1858656 RepID=A0A6M4MAL3_9ALTE|nr:response regulator [Alteromonas pelagimontana]QJR80077.1 response regulator [Alteromonas pelagimontana]